jgi:hypothetical protein
MFAWLSTIASSIATVALSQKKQPKKKKLKLKKTWQIIVRSSVSIPLSFITHNKNNPLNKNQNNS